MTVLSIYHGCGDISSPDLGSTREEIQNQPRHLPFEGIGSLEISAKIRCTQSWVHRNNGIRDHTDQRPDDHLQQELWSAGAQ